ncbi:hypothetical protein MHYP_G00073660 [Metynnis hypsauchen]
MFRNFNYFVGKPLQHFCESFLSAVYINGLNALVISTRIIDKNEKESGKSDVRFTESLRRNRLSEPIRRSHRTFSIRTSLLCACLKREGRKVFSHAIGSHACQSRLWGGATAGKRPTRAPTL